MKVTLGEYEVANFTCRYGHLEIISLVEIFVICLVFLYFSRQYSRVIGGV